MRKRIDVNGISLEYEIGDCLELMKDIPDNSIDLVLTDPPFLQVLGTYDGEGIGYGNFLILEEWWFNVAFKIRRVLKNQKMFFILCDWRSYPFFWRAMLRANYVPLNCIIWYHKAARHYNQYRFTHSFLALFGKEKIKPRCPPGTKEGFDLWEFGNEKTQLRLMPSQKPVNLFQKVIVDNSNERDLIFDPFLGSGTTLLTCKETGRNGIGFEINPAYEPIIRKRIMADTPAIEDYTGVHHSSDNLLNSKEKEK